MSEVTGRYTLAKPIMRKFREAGGAEREEALTEVTMREPVAGDLRVTDGAKGEAGAGLAMIARLTGLDIAVVDRLSLPDFRALSEMVAAFMPPGLPTGETS